MKKIVSSLIALLMAGCMCGFGEFLSEGEVESTSVAKQYGIGDTF